MKKQRIKQTIVTGLLLILSCIIALSGCQASLNDQKNNFEYSKQATNTENFEYHNGEYLLKMFFEDIDQVIERLGYTEDDLEELSQPEAGVYVKLKIPVQYQGIDFDFYLCRLNVVDQSKFAGTIYRTSFSIGQEEDLYNAMNSLFVALGSQYGEGDTQEFDMNFTEKTSKEKFVNTIGQKHFFHDWDLETVDTYYIRLEAVPVIVKDGLSRYDLQVFVGLGYQDPLRTDYSAIEEQVKKLGSDSK